MIGFEIANLASYQNQYPQLGAALGFPEAAPAPGELEFLAEVTSQDWRRVGMLPPANVFFAAAVTSILQPRRALEIGTAGGFSAAILAKMIALREKERGAPGSNTLLHTIDKRADFVFDPAQPVGFAIDRLAPELRDRIAVHPLQDSSFCRQLDGDFSFAFIDGNHRHPWPLTDFIRVQALMESGWVLLHDVDLPGEIARAQAKGETVEATPAFGAKHLFDFWPAPKIQSGNIGVIELARARDSLGKLIAKLRELPSEVSPGSWKKQWREIDALSSERSRN